MATMSPEEVALMIEFSPLPQAVKDRLTNGPYRIRNWQVRYCLMFERFGLAGGIGCLVGAIIGAMLEHEPLALWHKAALSVITVCAAGAIAANIWSPVHRRLRLSHKDWITRA